MFEDDLKWEKPKHHEVDDDGVVFNISVSLSQNAQRKIADRGGACTINLSIDLPDDESERISR